MEKKNKLIVIFLIILTLSVVGVCIYSVINNKKENKDAIKFRNEYSELNGQINELNQKEYVNVSISDNNTVKYINEKKAVELLESGTGIIYFGFNKCPWCRSIVETLTNVCKDNNETLYYLDISDIRSTFELNEGEVSKIKDGSKGYYEILDILDEYLEDFSLTDAAGNVYDTGEKRLYAPTIVAFNNGSVTKMHVGTVSSQESGYDELTEEEIKEFSNIVKDLIKSKKVNVCTSDKC